MSTRSMCSPPAITKQTEAEKVSLIEKGAAYFREKAEFCRTLTEKASRPDIVDALEELAREFDEAADWIDQNRQCTDSSRP